MGQKETNGLVVNEDGKKMRKPSRKRPRNDRKKKRRQRRNL